MAALLPLTVSAQDDAPPIPPLAMTPARTAWTVDFTYSGTVSEAAEREGYRAAMQRNSEADPVLAKFLKKHPRLAETPARIRRVEVTKDGDTRRDMTIRTDATREDRWQWGVWFAKETAAGINLESLGGGAPDDFPELSWLERRHFKELKKINGKPCAVFEAKIDPLRLTDPRLFRQIGGSTLDDPATATVTVSVESRLPLSVECAGIKRIYHYNDPPTGKLELPPAIAAQIRLAEKRAADRAAPLSPP